MKHYSLAFASYLQATMKYLYLLVWEPGWGSELIVTSVPKMVRFWQIAYPQAPIYLCNDCIMFTVQLSNDLH